MLLIEIMVFIVIFPTYLENWIQLFIAFGTVGAVFVALSENYRRRRRERIELNVDKIKSHKSFVSKKEFNKFENRNSNYLVQIINVRKDTVAKNVKVSLETLSVLDDNNDIYKFCSIGGIYFCWPSYKMSLIKKDIHKIEYIELFKVDNNNQGIIFNIDINDYDDNWVIKEGNIAKFQILIEADNYEKIIRILFEVKWKDTTNIGILDIEEQIELKMIDKHYI
jgi:hypothetical protein